MTARSAIFPGQPLHPIYQPASAPLVPWSSR